MFSVVPRQRRAPNLTANQTPAPTPPKAGDGAVPVDREKPRQFGRLRLAALILLAVAAAFVLWLLIKDSDEEKSTPTKTVESASETDIRKLPGNLGHPVWWAGPRPGFTYELTKAPVGTRPGCVTPALEGTCVYIRYLPPGVAVNDRRPNFLTVGSYPYPRAFATARAQGRQPGAFNRKLPGGGVVYSTSNKPKSVYVAFPGRDYLYEVYDPEPKRARRLVLSGRVGPID